MFRDCWCRLIDKIFHIERKCQRFFCFNKIYSLDCKPNNEKNVENGIRMTQLRINRIYHKTCLYSLLKMRRQYSVSLSISGCEFVINVSKSMISKRKSVSVCCKYSGTGLLMATATQCSSSSNDSSNIQSGKCLPSTETLLSLIWLAFDRFSVLNRKSILCRLIVIPTPMFLT